MAKKPTNGAVNKVDETEETTEAQGEATVGHNGPKDDELSTYVNEIEAEEAAIDSLRMEHAAAVGGHRKNQKSVKDRAKRNGVPVASLNRALVYRKHKRDLEGCIDKLEDDGERFICERILKACGDLQALTARAGETPTEAPAAPPAPSA